MESRWIQVIRPISEPGISIYLGGVMKIRVRS